jgi:DhnA family fructose-bisphosphate aldolase class Ia
MSDLRWHRIFGPDGRTLIVAMDHPGYQAAPGLEHPDEFLTLAAAAGADAVLTTFGTIERFGAAFRGLGVVLRMDGAQTQMGGRSGSMRLIHTVEAASRLGVDAVAAMCFPGAADESDSLERAGRLADEAHAAGLPVMLETLPGGFSGQIPWTGDSVATAARIAAELGADFIKTAFTGDDFGRVPRTAGIPVIVLGGERSEREADVVEAVSRALDYGAAGVAMGRNIWGHPDPAAMIQSLRAVIHQGASVQHALSYLK